MARSPVRLEKALTVFKNAMTDQGCVYDPAALLLQNAGFQDGATVLKKLAASGQIQILDQTDTKRPRITRIQMTMAEKTVIKEAPKTVLVETSNFHLCKEKPPCKWKEAKTCLEQIFILLKESAHTHGDILVVEDPLLLLENSGFKHPSPYLSFLKKAGLIEIFYGQGRNGRGIAKIQIQETLFDIKKLKARARDQKKYNEEKTEKTSPRLLIKNAESSFIHHPPDPPAISVKAVPTALTSRCLDTKPVIRVVAKRVIAFLDLENLFCHANELNQELDMLKIYGECKKQGTLVGFKCFVSEETYRCNEWWMRAMLFTNGHPLILTRNGKDEVDRIILEEIRLALRHSIADVFIIGTHDGGEYFKMAISEIVSSAKEFMPLVADSDGLSRLFRQNSAPKKRIYALAEDPQQEKFKAILREVYDTKEFCGNSIEKNFIVEIVKMLMSYPYHTHPVGFKMLWGWVWNRLSPLYRKEFREVDCKFVLEALSDTVGILYHKTIHRASRHDQRSLYYIKERHYLLPIILSA